ncbi:MAG: hypothetical protein AB1488_04795 [Nitrospirota bacterium]
MTLIKWSPHRDIDALRRDIEKTFEDFFGEDFAIGPLASILAQEKRT